ncbi:MAG: hypothetical protein AB1489_17165 [Acidobacteriota bacterium]
MRAKVVLLFLLITLLVTACVPSLHPIYTEQVLITNPDLIGSWLDEEDGDTWTFQAAPDNVYNLIQKTDKSLARLKVALVHLGNHNYLDIFPEEPTKAEFKNSFYKSHFFPVHTFSKITIEKDQLQLAMLNQSWIENMLVRGEIEIRYEESEQGFLLTSSTAELQRLLLEHGDDPGLFRKPIKLRRKQNDEPSNISSQQSETKATPALAVAPASTIKTQTPLPFDFHVGFWLNLHHFLYQQAFNRAQIEGERSTSKETVPTQTIKLTPAEQQAWTAAVNYYQQTFTKRELLFDDELVMTKNRLAELESAIDLKCSGLRTELINVLEQAAPIYRKHWWPAHEHANRAWIDNLSPLLQRFGTTLVEQLSIAYREKWPAQPMRVDVVAYAHRLGAYTTLSPTHIMIGSLAPNNQDLLALEIIFHEASHALIEKTSTAIRQASQARKRTVPRDLWHALLFYTTGELVKRTLKTGGLGDYTPYAYRFGLYERAPGWRDYQRVLELHWQPYLDTKTDADTALPRLLEALQISPTAN